MLNIQDLITSLELQPHIEGGYFKETYRSEAQTIFGAEVLDAHSFSLTSCMVAPGFDFTDFQLYDKAELMERFADLAPIILHLHQ